MINEGKQIDVLDTMFLEMRECVHLQKSLIFAPLIQALIESVCQPEFIDSASYPVAMPRRDRDYRPPPPASYKAPKKERNPRPEDRATFTPGCSSTARIPRSRAPRAVDDAPAAFTRHEKKILFKTISNLFKMCQSMQKRQLKDVNHSKASH